MTDPLPDRSADAGPFFEARELCLSASPLARRSLDLCLQKGDVVRLAGSRSAHPEFRISSRVSAMVRVRSLGRSAKSGVGYNS